MNAVTFASFWTDSKVLLLFHQNDILRVAGMVLLFVATLLYIVSMKHWRIIILPVSITIGPSGSSRKGLTDMSATQCICLIFYWA
jgi:hypothetical protein